ncbi:alpha/beta fold hydrolase [Phytoactinopolyspora mesophila]|uniref:Alpha/beta fold hydrolase n=1 Tax=Phytoactinopolyspora mesophila TaxID=2650750 RepID=A0A7K3M0Z1_9ACTN|nr:alpha/beta fold hydrolase [Phytoactinopolyspora mesophila]NDL56920.1 alpha/beta fold hydrolase [Phytoactinopolyspora mesophila]
MSQTIPPARRRWPRRLLLAFGGVVMLGVLALAGLAYVWNPPEPDLAGSEFHQEHPPSTVDTGVARFSYQKFGHGPAVVMVHGGGEWSYTFRDTVQALRDEYTVYLVDMPGNGYTTTIDPGFSFDVPAMTSALDAFVDAVGLEEFALVGHSWGGGWSLRYAQLHPERVSSLTLLGASGIDEPDVWDWRIFEVPMVGEAMVKLMGRGDVADFLHKAFVNGERVTDELVDEVSRTALQADNRRALVLSQRRLDWSETERDLGNVDIPTLIVWGAQDAFLPAEFAGRLGDGIHGSEVHRLEGCGHNVHADCPEQVEQLLLDFLDE